MNDEVTLPPQFFQTVIDALASEIVVLDSVGSIVAFNSTWQEFARLNGLDPKQVGIGTNYLAVCDRAAMQEGDDHQEAITAATLIRGLLNGRYEKADFSYPCHSPHHERYFTCEAVRIEFDGAGYAVLAHTDITVRRTAELNMQLAQRELRESEVKFRSLLFASPDAMIIVDRSGIIDFASNRLSAIFGYLPSEVVGKPLSILIPERYRGAHAGHLHGYFEAPTLRGMGAGMDLYALRKDMSEFPVEISLSPVVSHGDLSVIALIRDITQQKQAGMALKESEARLSQAQKMEAIGQLTGGVAHDFNNLLTVILGNADQLVENIKDPELLSQALMIQKTGERGADLTESLLAFARRQVLQPQIVNANRLLVNMTDLLRRILGEQIEVEFVQAAGLWNIMVDPIQLEGALLNLALNARDAMPGGGRLTIDTANSHIDQTYSRDYIDVPPGQYVAICVSDTGTGMSTEVEKRVFEPFFTTKEVGKGTGLGLSTVYGFIKQSGGHIKCYSEIGEGASFKMYLPRSNVGIANVSNDTSGSSGDDEPEGTETILMVEDDDLVRNHVERSLLALGYRVLVACDGKEAVQILESDDHVDLLFTDVVMPGGLNGRQLANKAEALRPLLPILFTSGYTENAIVHGGLLDDGVHLLKKPFRRRELAWKLRQILDQARRD